MTQTCALLECCLWSRACVSATARDRAGKRCKELNLACEVWGRTDLDARVQPYPDIIATFFTGGQVGAEGTVSATVTHVTDSTVVAVAAI